MPNELLVSINIDRNTKVNVSPYDLSDMLTSPKSFGEGGYAFPVLTDGKVSGFMHVSYIEKPHELVLRPTGRRRYNFNYER